MAIAEGPWTGFYRLGCGGDHETASNCGMPFVVCGDGVSSACRIQVIAEQQARLEQIRGIIASEHPQAGNIHLAASDATLHLGETYYFLNADEAKKVIVDGWRNPPSSADGVLGMVLPKGKVFANSWGAVITYEATGYVPDNDAKTADYDKFIAEIRKGEDEVNQQRSKDGFPTIHLVGWAQPPTYDSKSHSEVWARRIQFGNEPVDTLNYDTRILGRRGVLSLNLISDIDHLAEARQAANELATTATFDSGSRYADYQDGDKKAAYGVAGLVAAGLGLAVAKKFGLLAVILLFAKKGAVVVLAALAWAGNKFKSVFGISNKKKTAPGPMFLSDEPPEPPEQAP